MSPVLSSGATLCSTDKGDKQSVCRKREVVFPVVKFRSTSLRFPSSSGDKMERDGPRLFDVQLDSPKGSYDMTFDLKYRTRFPLTHCCHVPRVTSSCKKLKHHPLSKKKKEKKRKDMR